VDEVFCTKAILVEVTVAILLAFYDAEGVTEDGFGEIRIPGEKGIFLVSENV
jgi:hypothetical protein